MSEWKSLMRDAIREALRLAREQNALTPKRNLSIVITELEAVQDRVERAVNEVEGTVTA